MHNKVKVFNCIIFNRTGHAVHAVQYLGVDKRALQVVPGVVQQGLLGGEQLQEALDPSAGVHHVLRHGLRGLPLALAGVVLVQSLQQLAACNS